MDYPFSQFLRHIQMWRQAQELTEVYPKPEEDGGDKPIHIGSDSSEAAVHLRIMHMLSIDGCTPAERKYRGLRFFSMQRFIALHHAVICSEFTQLHDGERISVPNAVLRAVHETFRGEPLRHSDREPINPVIQRAKTYTGTWSYE